MEPSETPAQPGQTQPKRIWPNGKPGNPNGQAERHPLKKLRAIIRDLADGMTVKQATARAGCSDEWYFKHTRAGSKYEYLRDAGEAAMIRGRLKIIKKIEKDSRDDKTRLAAATWLLEKVYRRQYGQDDRNLNIHAQQNNYILTEERAREIEARRQASLARLEAQGIVGNGERATDSLSADGTSLQIGDNGRRDTQTN